MDTGTGVPTTLPTVLGVSLPLTVSHLAAIASHCQALSAIISHFQPTWSTIFYTWTYLTYPGEKGNAPTTHYYRILCALRVFCLRSQQPRQGQGQGTSGEFRRDVFYLAPPWFNAG